MKFTYFTIYFVVIIGFITSCNVNKKSTKSCNDKKISFSIEQFDEKGLIGGESKSSLDYEFCIPNTPEALNKVLEIDSSIMPLKGKGRTRCNETYIVMIGNSYNKDIKTILCKLSNLEFIKEINQVFWE